MKFKEKLFFVIPLLYLCISLYSLSKIGFGWDTSVNLVKGEQVYNFIRTLNSSYLVDSNYSSGIYDSRYFNEIPSYENGHPPAYSFLSFTVGHFFSQLFGFKYYYFHILNVLLTTVFLYFFQKFVYKLTNNVFLSILTGLILISLPHFYIYTVTNTKDLPVAIFTFLSIYLLVIETNKNFIKISTFVIFLCILSLYSKFTSLFLFPLILYLLITHRKFKKSLRNYYVIGMWFLTFLLSTCALWPHLFFNTVNELDRLRFVYFVLPAESPNYYPFVYFFVQKVPVIFTFLFSLSVPYVLILSKNRTLFAIWLLPALAYLIFINRYYELFRQFLFLFVPLVICLGIFLGDLIDKYLSKLAIARVFCILVLTFYSCYLLMLPAYKKVYFSSVFFNEGSKDVWALSLPVALDYVYKNYEPDKIYFSPLAFLLEYYDVRDRGYEIVYDPKYTNIFIATTKVNPYEEEREVREAYYSKDLRFIQGQDVMEIWFRK